MRHFVCTVCDAVVLGEICPAECHWLEARLGRRTHRVVRCNGNCLADRIGVEAARNVTMRHSLGLWTNEDLVARLDVLKRRIEERGGRIE